MRKIILATLLGLGVIAGFSHGIWSVRHHHGNPSCQRESCERSWSRYGCDQKAPADPATPAR
ncbi:MAG: hypothetical protein IT383_08900 [Deltaproteobacteria bacterium]|nr:hypothetical protein [Deltaproteobacteria bacterium]